MPIPPSCYSPAAHVVLPGQCISVLSSAFFLHEVSSTLYFPFSKAPDSSASLNPSDILVDAILSILFNTNTLPCNILYMLENNHEHEHEVW